MRKTVITEADAIIEFREREMTWKHWAILAVVNLVAYIFFTGLATIFRW